MDYTTILEQILTENKYLSLATSDKNALPWASPVAYQFDNHENAFYFISSPDSRHIKNISENPAVAFSIYNSSQIAGTAFGIQGSGTATRVDSVDIPVFIRGTLLSMVSMVVLNRYHEFYKISVDTMYLPHVERWKEEMPFRALVIGKASDSAE